MSTVRPRSRYWWLIVAFGILWFTRGLYESVWSPAANLTSRWLGISITLGSCLCLALATVAVGSSAPIHRHERARSILVILLLLHAAVLLPALVLFFVQFAAGVQSPYFSVSFVPFGTMSIWLGLAMLMGWL